MPMSFSYIQPNTLLPLFYAEVTSSAEPISENLRLLLIGHGNKGGATYNEGTAVENTLYLISGTIATTLFGRGSMLDWMYQKARQNAPTAEIWAIQIPEAVTGVRATKVLTILNTASAARSGLARIWIAGRAVDIIVTQTMTKEQIAVAFQTRINQMSLPVKASGATGATGEFTITLTCRWAGVTGNEIYCGWVGPGGRATSSTPPVQLARLLVGGLGYLAGGAGEAEVMGTFAAIGDQDFDVFCWATSALSSTVGFPACREFMNNETGRWSPSQQLYGHMFTTKIGDYQELYDFADVQNDPHMSVLAVKHSVMPTWEWTAALCGVVVTHWAAPPELSRPLQTLELHGISVGTDDDETFTKSEREVLLNQGLSTFGLDRANIVRLDRVRTLRKYNVYGDPDVSWADAVTMFQAQFFVRSMRAAITNAFPRCALTDLPIGINGFASATDIEMVIIHNYKRLAALGLVEHTELFAQYLIVERDLVDRNRVNVLMRPDFVNQLRVVAVIVETHLELDPTDPQLLAAA